MVCAAVLNRSAESESFATPWTVAHQAPLSVGILQARILEWLALLQGIFPNQGSNPGSPSLQADSLLSEPPRKLKNTGVGIPSLLQGILLTQELNWDLLGFLDSSVGKESACSAGDPGSVRGLGRSTGEGIGYPLQYSWASLVA